MDVRTLIDNLHTESNRLVKEFLGADREYQRARVKNDQNTMAYWWNEEKKISDRASDIAIALRIIKEFAEEGPA